MPNALIDVDDTIAETQALFIEETNRRHGTTYAFDKMTRAYRENTADQFWDDAVHTLLKEPEVMSRCVPSDGALSGIVTLLEAGWHNHIVTARKADLQTTTETWLSDRGFWNSVHKYHVRGDERGAEFKVRVAEEVGFDAAFDDTLEIALALAPVVETVYLIDKPWNRGFDDELPNNIVRVGNFLAGAIQAVR